MKKFLLIFIALIFSVALANGQPVYQGVKGGATITVAASDSKSRIADYVCTGTNDQAVINTAISAASPGGRVILSDGTFYINNVTAQAYGILIDIANNSHNVTLEGQGMGTLLKVPDGNSTTMSVIRVQGTSTVARIGGVRIKNLRIDGNESGVAASTQFYNGIAVQYGTNVEIDGVYLSNGKGQGGDGYGYLVDGSTYVTIRNSTGLDWDFEPMEIRDSSNIVISNNTLGHVELYDTVDFTSFINNTFVTVGTSGGMSVGTDTLTSSFCDGLKINNNTFYGAGVALGRAMYAEVTGNVHYMTTASSAGITATLGGFHTVTGNVFYISFSGLTGIQATFLYSTIANNYFYMSESVYGISLSNGTYNVISNNYGYNSNPGLYATVLVNLPSGSNYNTVENNTCYNAGTCIKADGAASNYNMIYRNRFFGSMGWGIEVYGTGNTVKENELRATFSHMGVEDYGTGNIIEGTLYGGVALTLAVWQLDGTAIYNTGQGPNNRNHTLPAEIAGLSFSGIVGEAQAANYWRFTATTANSMCLDGTCGKDYVQIAAPTQGARVDCETVKSASTGINGTATLVTVAASPNVGSGAFTFDISGAGYSKAAVALGTAPGNDVIPSGTYGAVALDIGADGTVDAVEATDNATGYASSALAIAGVPAVAAVHVRMGYVTATKSDGNLTFGTTNLDAANVTVAYTQATAYTKPYWWHCHTVTGTWATD